MREEIAQFLYYDTCERAGIWNNISPLTQQQFLNKTDRLLALLKQAGYVQLDKDQSLPEDYGFPQTIQSKERMRQYQSGEIDKEIHNALQSVIVDEQLAVYKKAQQDMLKENFRRIRRENEQSATE